MRRPRSARGETLIETMVAMAVFSIALLGILEMNLCARGQLSVAGRETKAANLARDLIDAFDRLPYENPAFAAGDHALTDSALTDDVAQRPLLGAAQPIARVDVPRSTQVRWTCTEDDDADGNPQGMRIRIRVTFPVLGHQTKTLAFDTYKYRLAAVTGSSDPAGAI